VNSDSRLNIPTAHRTDTRTQTSSERKEKRVNRWLTLTRLHSR
jgi:hypothetical protein